MYCQGPGAPTQKRSRKENASAAANVPGTPQFKIKKTENTPDKQKVNTPDTAEWKKAVQYGRRKLVWTSGTEVRICCMF